MDSRFRGNDCEPQRPRLANDATATLLARLESTVRGAILRRRMSIRTLEELPATGCLRLRK